MYSHSHLVFVRYLVLMLTKRDVVLGRVSHLTTYEKNSKGLTVMKGVPVVNDSFGSPALGLPLQILH
jgi:hypothetical protein